jgi:hypothetical protein
LRSCSTRPRAWASPRANRRACSRRRGALGSDAFGRLGNDYVLRRFVFSRDASATEDYATLPAPGTETALAGSLLQVLRQARTSAVGAVVIVSDGGENAGTLDQEQLAEIASLGVPVHTIGVGRERVPEDLELQEVLAPERTLPGTTLSARVTIRHDGAGVARLKVYDGDKFLASRDIALPEDGTVTTAFVDFGLQEPGVPRPQFLPRRQGRRGRAAQQHALHGRRGAASPVADPVCGRRAALGIQVHAPRAR